MKIKILVFVLGLCVGLTSSAMAADALSDRSAFGSETDLGDLARAGSAGYGPGQYEFHVSGSAWGDRPYRIHVPGSYDTDAPLPLILVFHGSGSNAVEMARTTCRGLTAGDPPSVQHPSCLHHMAGGAITAYLNGAIETDSPIHPSGGYRRSWNAGGGRSIDGVDYKCVSSAACVDAADDVGYVLDVLADIGRRFDIDPARVHAVGISNGGAMVHRLACEIPQYLASIAAVAGTSHQYLVDLAEGGHCTTSATTAVLQIIGDADEVAPPGGGPSPLFPAQGSYISIEETLYGFKGEPGLLARNGCDGGEAAEEIIPNSSPLDGSPGGTIYRFPGCERPIVLYRMWGAGHTWPGGWQYLGQWLIGATNRDISANAEILEFFGL